MTRRNWTICLTPPLIAAILLAAGCHKPDLPTQPPRLVETAAKAGDAGTAIARAADTAAVPTASAAAPSG